MRIEKGTSLKEDLQWFYFHFPMPSSHFYKALKARPHRLLRLCQRQRLRPS